MKVVRQFGVATGQAVYPTPLGTFQIVVKWKNPWWYPPASPWAKGEKPVPPGPGNPLGTRWMGLSAPGVGIHGTPRGRLDRLLALARLHPHAHPAGGVAVRPRRRRHAGVHRLCLMRTLKLTGQVVALAAVAGLLGLLVWRLTHQSKPPKIGGPAPAFSLEARRRGRDARPRVAARQARRAELLGVVVRAVQGRGDDARAGLAAVPRAGRRLRRRRLPRRHGRRAHASSRITASRIRPCRTAPG